MSNTPRKGDPITYRGTVVGHVVEVDGNICWYRRPNGTSGCFIWQHPDCLNALHDWPTKHAEGTP